MCGQIPILTINNLSLFYIFLPQKHYYDVANLCKIREIKKEKKIFRSLLDGNFISS
ncbi:hypothetical protein BACEGG_02025 [Bacteroides eggerthii DSM 20697]|nr:hypothetical protein BACEGG_02025 [Bacteroides eggerthii DSM 20697]